MPRSAVSVILARVTCINHRSSGCLTWAGSGNASAKNPTVALFVATKALTRAMRSLSECDFNKDVFFAALGGEFALVRFFDASPRSGQAASKSSDFSLGFVRTGCLTGETFAFTWPVIPCKLGDGVNTLQFRFTCQNAFVQLLLTIRDSPGIHDSWN